MNDDSDAARQTKMARVWEAYAHSFKSDLPLAQILATLQKVGPWRWIERDSERWGEYISSRVIPEPENGMVKIFVEHGFYVANVVLDSREPDYRPRFDAVRETLLKRIFPAIGARDISETDGRE